MPYTLRLTAYKLALFEVIKVLQLLLLLFFIFFFLVAHNPLKFVISLPYDQPPIP